MIRPILIVVFLWTGGAGLSGEKQPPKKDPAGEEVAKSKKALDDHLQKIKAVGGQVLPVTSPALARSFPDTVFFALRFRQFPVAKAPPKGLKSANLFQVSKEGKVQHLRDEKVLENLFRDRLEVKNKKAVQDALEAWLTLVPEFFQDGYYKFELAGTEIKDLGQGNWKATGRVIVMKGGNGDIKATLDFQEGKLAGFSQAGEIRSGPRPICQATKLLDSDPIVRKMAEQDLLIMGLAARGYLEEQRLRASPELRRAIDGLWKRIQKGGW